MSVRAGGFRYTLDVRSGTEWLAAVDDGRDARAEVPEEIAARLRAIALDLPLVGAVFREVEGLHRQDEEEDAVGASGAPAKTSCIGSR